MTNELPKLHPPHAARLAVDHLQKPQVPLAAPPSSGQGNCEPPIPAGAPTEVGEVPATEPRRQLIKIARTSQRAITLLLWKKQGGLCPLCGKEIDIKIPREGVMDHCHDSGEVRGILHRSCNAAEGKVANAAGQWGAKATDYPSIIRWLEAMLVYLKAPGTGYMYPTHKTAEEKHAASLYKRRQASAKRKAQGSTKVRSMKPKVQE